MRKRAVRAGSKTPHVMEGGPWDGKVLRLHTPGTLPFTVQGQTGRYNEKNRWVAL